MLRRAARASSGSARADGAAGGTGAAVACAALGVYPSIEDFNR